MVGIQPVDLEEVSDERKFQDIALLVDREDFLNDLQVFKSEAQRRYSETLELVQSFPLEFGIAVDLLRKYNYPQTFFQVMVGTARNNKVRRWHTSGLYSPIITRNNRLLAELLLQTPIHIVNTKLPWKRHHKVTEKELVEKIEEIFAASTTNPILELDIIPNLKRNRDLYWAKKMNKVISTGVLANQYFLAVNTVDKAISQYSKLLKI